MIRSTNRLDISLLMCDIDVGFYLTPPTYSAKAEVWHEWSGENDGERFAAVGRLTATHQTPWSTIWQVEYTYFTCSVPETLTVSWHDSPK
jgi:hypothetical protein